MKIGICGSNEKVALNNGKWVAQLPLDDDNEYKPFPYRFVGSIPNSIIRYEADELDESGNSYGEAYLYLVADEPFIAIAGDACLCIAREIQKGELGREPKIDTPPYTKGYYRLHWAKLTAVAEYAGMESKELFTMFYYFHDQYRFETGMICSVNGPDPEDENTFCAELDEQRRPCEWIYLDELRQEDEVYEPIGIPIDVDNIWVPAGCTNNVLRLVKFGYPKTVEG